MIYDRSRNRFPRPRERVFAASALESTATYEIKTSLTPRFIDLLSNIEEEEITVAQIHAKLVQQSNRPESHLTFTPVHIAASENPAVTLHRLQYLPREVRSLRKTNELADGKVLISVLLEGEIRIPDVEQWTEWLSTYIPEDVADIKIEAVFKSNSSLCLITMTIAVWDMVQRNEAFSLVRFVESNNILIHQQPTPGDVGVGAGVELLCFLPQPYDFRLPFGA